MVEWILDRVASERPTLLALDSPLGWPVALGESLVRHSAGAPLSPEPELLFRRLTDRVVRRRIGKQPLEVGADRIARTAVAALRLIDRIASQAGSPVELAWDAGRLPGIGAIETYPASWLLYQGLPARRYKDGSEVAGERRRAILARIGEVEAEGRGASLTAAAANAHLLDAVICVLIAGEFLIGRCPAPLPAERDLARREGWIWFPLAVD